MKNGLIGVVIAVFAIVTSIARTDAGSFDPERYEKADVKILQAAPEKLKNDRIWFETSFLKYTTTFFPYMEQSGFKAGEDFMISVQPVTLPVLAKKTDDLTTLLTSLKPGAKVKVYGRVKKFRRAPKYTRMPHYYIDLENFELIENGKGKGGKRSEEATSETPDSDGGNFQFKMPKRPRRLKR